MAYRLLLVGDDKPWADPVSGALNADYMVGRVTSAASALERINADGCDLVLLDCDSSAAEGMTWLKALRHTDAGKQLPVIAASARKTDDMVAQAFEWGADDFVLKSVEPVELLARVRSVLRRRFEREASFGSAMTIGSVTLDPARHKCLVRSTPVKLNPREFELLELLMRKAGRVLSRAYLLETLWGMSRFANTRTVDVSVSRLRKALGARAGRWVETVERYGYRFKDPEEVGR